MLVLQGSFGSCLGTACVSIRPCPNSLRTSMLWRYFAQSSGTVWKWTSWHKSTNFPCTTVPIQTSRKRMGWEQHCSHRTSSDAALTEVLSGKSKHITTWRLL